MEKNKLKIVRNKLDKLDLKLLSLVKKRTLLVNQVIKIKKHKKQIIDKVRINEILLKIRKNSIKKKIDPQITNKIWKSMIGSYIDYETKNFKKKIIIYCEEVTFFQQKFRVYELRDYIFLLLVLL